MVTSTLKCTFGYITLHAVRAWVGSASAERVGQGEVGGVIHRVTCTWWLLGSALKGNGWYWVSRLEVDMGSILELELGQK